MRLILVRKNGQTIKVKELGLKKGLTVSEFEKQLKKIIKTKK